MLIIIFIILLGVLSFLITRFFHKKHQSTSDKIAIVGIGISTYVGFLVALLSIKITLYISNQDVKIDGFNALLSKSDATIDKLNAEIGLLKDQLKLNENAQNTANQNAEYSEEANMNRFSGAILKLGATIGTKEMATKDEIMPTHFYINGLKEILESQIENPYIFKNDSLKIAWMEAYKQLYFYTDEWERANFNKKDFDPSFNTGENKTIRLNEIAKNKKQDVEACWIATNKAYIIGVKYLKQDKRFQNLK